MSIYPGVQKTLKTYLNLFPQESLSHNIYTADQVRLVEPRAAKMAGMSMYQLMENAGKFVFTQIRQHFSSACKILVLAGLQK